MDDSDSFSSIRNINRSENEKTEAVRILNL